MASNSFWLHLQRAQLIMRRYVVTNGFDGALTLLGMVAGFQASGATDMHVAFSACLGATVALFISGLSSAYLSEKAERQAELKTLEQALMISLENTDYGRASRYLPWMVSLANGLAPLVLSAVILLPMGLAVQGVALPVPPLLLAMGLALIELFLLGVFLGQISQSFWLWSGLRTLMTALVTLGVIFALG